MRVSAREPGVPKVDPLRKQGPVRHAFGEFIRSPAGRWFSINVASRVDPYLLKATRGYASLALMLPSVNVTTTGAKSGQPRTATILYFTDGDDVILVASSFGRDKRERAAAIGRTIPIMRLELIS
jgi:hypothetical protein